MRHYNKIILSLALIVVLLLGINIISFADPLAGAIVGGMGAMGATIGATGATVGTYSTFISGSDNNLSGLDPLGEYYIKYEKNKYTDPTSGISFDGVWYSHDFAEKFQAEGIAFLNDYSVQPDSSDIIFSGTGTYDGLPVYSDGTNYFTQAYTFSGLTGFTWGSRTGEITQNGSYYKATITSLVNPDVTTNIYTTARTPYLALRYTLGTNPNISAVTSAYKSNPDYSWGSFETASSNLPKIYIEDAFEFDYVSGTIDTTTIESNEGLQILIPSGYVPNTIPSGTYQIDSGSGTDNILAISVAVNEAGNDNKITNPTWAIEPIPPEPTPTVEPSPVIVIPSPYPTTIPEDDNMPIGTAPWGWLKDLFNESILTLDDILDNIAEKVAELADTIANGTEEFIREVFGDIPNVFGGWFSDLKNSFGIWHYVVEWWQCIASYFSFLMTIANGMPSCFIAPLYAVVAGTIVLGVYKRFGQ